MPLPTPYREVGTVMSNTKWLGLWKQERQGFYAGQVIKKGEIPKYTRIVLRYNKYYDKDSSRPRFVYCFADSEGYASKCVPIELEESEDLPYKGDDGNYYTETGERLYTREDARAIINGTFRDCQYGISDPYDILPEDFA